MLLFMMALLGTRNPVKPFWANEMVMSCFITTSIVALLAIGTAYVIQSLLNGSWPSLKDFGYTGVILAASFLLYKYMGVRRKIEAYEAAGKSAQIIEVDFRNDQPDDHTQPPLQPTSGFRKAA